MKLGTNLYSIFMLLGILAVPNTVIANDGLVLSESLLFQGGGLFLVVIVAYSIYRYTSRKNTKLDSSPIIGDNFSQSLIDISPDAIIVVDDEMCVESFNHAAEILFGFSRDEVV